MKVSLKTITPNAELNIVEIARVSSSRKDKTEKPEGLINYLIKNKHWSPFEMSHLTFEIETSKAIAIQLLRHRSMAFQELSMRYQIIEDIEPVQLRKQSSKNRQSSVEEFDPMIPSQGEAASSLVQKHLDSAMELYQQLLEAGVARECARMVLPMATRTTIYMTGSVRSWIHFLAVRDDEHAQLEAQLIAKEIKKIFVKELPIISTALEYEEKV